MYMQIRGKQLYVEVAGTEHRSAILYFHGGPGGVGCLDFMATTAQGLANHLKVIGFDQRGTLRSQAYEVDEAVTLTDVVDDAESIRIALGIKSWSVLGHSYGGYLAVLYALRYPQSTTALLLESPSFSFTLSEQALLRKNAALFREQGDEGNAARCLALAEVSEPQDATLGELSTLLGEKAGGILHAGNDWSFLNRIAYEAALPQEVWANSGRTRARVLAEGTIYQSIIPRLSELSMPALLMKGEHDPITCEKQVDAFRMLVPNGRTERFSTSGHWIRHEEPRRYIDTVLDFLSSVGANT